MTSCSNENTKKIYIGNKYPSLIVYENGTLSGTISYKNLEKDYLKIVTLSYNDEILEPKLMFNYLYEYRPMRGGGWSDTNLLY